jgi:hypothetical protein
MTGKTKRTGAEVLRPNFGQHTPAIAELLKSLSETIRYRDSAQNSADQYRGSLHQEEQKLLGYNHSIESYRSAIRALGGEVPEGSQ